MADIVVRLEAPGDVAAIRDLTTAAFAGAPHASGNEAAIVDGLRRDGDLALSLVAADGDEITGHVAFSPVAVGGSDDGWFGLGPVSVLPASQRQGIGTALIERGLAELRGRAARGCVLVGDPAYYARFGFRAGTLSYEGVPGSYVQGLGFEGAVPSGEVTYARAFAAG